MYKTQSKMLKRNASHIKKMMRGINKGDDARILLLNKGGNQEWCLYYYYNYNYSFIDESSPALFHSKGSGDVNRGMVSITFMIMSA